MNQEMLYSVVTLFDCMQDPSTVAWLLHANVPLPEDVPPGRYPTPAEIRGVVDGVPGIRADYLVSDTAWEVTVRHLRDVCWASLTIVDYCGDPDQPHQFFFRAGWDETILLVASHLVKRCGPLVLLHDSGALPQFVTG